MKSIISIYLSLSCALQVRAEEPTPEIAGLEKAASDFVIAYNDQNAAAIAALFTEEGEMTDLSGSSLTSGREQIQARYEEVFAETPLQIAIEVDSVRLVAPNLAIEDGTYHLTPAEDESASPKSTTYTAVLMKGEGGNGRLPAPAASRTSPKRPAALLSSRIRSRASGPTAIPKACNSTLPSAGTRRAPA